MAGEVMSLRPCVTCGTGILVGWQHGGSKYCSEDCKPRCEVEGCEQPRRKRDWCASHYSQWKRMGEVKPFTYKWAERAPCLVCGNETAGSRYRQLCSVNCSAFWHYNNGVVPNEIECAGCGTTVKLNVPSRSGRHRRRMDVKLCKKCKTPHSKKWMSVTQLATRDGDTCKLCGGKVDLTLYFPNPMRASNDHVIPRGHGGSALDPENQQLTHLLCNQIKNHRIDPGPIDPTSSIAYKRYVSQGSGA